MRKLILIFCLIFFSIKNIKAQTRGTVNFPLGLYFGGVSNGAEQSGVGYYYFKSDSSFLFLGTTFDPNKKPNGSLKNVYTDTLESFGKGKWSFSKSRLLIKFETFVDINLRNDFLKYQSSSASPFDSILIKVKIKNAEIAYGTPVFLKGTGLFFITDSFGNGQIRIPYKFYNYQLSISHPLFYTKTIDLIPNNNVHEIEVCLAKQNDSAIKIVSAFSFFAKVSNVKNEFEIQYFKKEKAGIEKLKQILSTGYTRLPQQKYFIDKIMEEVNLLKAY